MGTMLKTAALLGKSLFTSDLPILLFALLELVLFFYLLKLRQDTAKELPRWQKKKNPPFSGYLRLSLSQVYTLFLTGITIFPLLGMLGTVFGLLGLDLAGGDMNNIKNNFFIALTSTAWGIIFSVLFKILNAFFADDIEDQIEMARQLSMDAL